jgi:hypothetical protein
LYLSNPPEPNFSKDSILHPQIGFSDPYTAILQGWYLPSAISKLLAIPEALYLSIQIGDFVCEKSRTKQGLKRRDRLSPPNILND